RSRKNFIDPDSRPADLCFALRVTISLFVGLGGAFEGGGGGKPDLDAVGHLAVAREKAPSDEVVDDRAGDRDRDERDPAPEALTVARLLNRRRRAPPRPPSPPGRAIRST